MAFGGSAIGELLDNAVSRGAVHGIAAVVVERGPRNRECRCINAGMQVRS